MMGFSTGGKTLYKTAESKSIAGEERALGLIYENRAVQINKEKTVKWGRQVEKALCLPWTEGILSTAEKM